jgi:hypothetical protein
MKQLLFLVLSFSSYGQHLHHQMLSAQGGSNQVVKGLILHQTIGQQSVIGNHTLLHRSLGQGFQQTSLAKSNSMLVTNQIITQVYPNPFVDRIQFQFSSPIYGMISVTIFDMLGRLIYSESKEASNSILILENLRFTANDYVVKLSTTNYNFATQIIKIK